MDSVLCCADSCPALAERPAGPAHWFPRAQPESEMPTLPAAQELPEEFHPSFASPHSTRPINRFSPPSIGRRIRLHDHAFPFPAVGRPHDLVQPNPMLRWIAPRISGNDHVIAWLQRVARHMLLRQLGPAAPFDGVDRRRPALGVRYLNLHER